MATEDVSVHVEEVVVVTTPDNIMDGSMEEVKAVLVTTNSFNTTGCSRINLQCACCDDVHEADSCPNPLFSVGCRSLAEEAMESESVAAAAAAAFNASTELKEAVLVKMEDEDEETLEAEIAYAITCGESKANLIWRKFVCPGINVKCVQYNEHLISPKEFVHLAGKSTLKDWKRAIRMNGVMLRKIMDSGELDFYQHSKVCSNTCRSTKIDVTGNRVSLCSQVSTEYIPITTSSDTFTVNGSPATITIETCDGSGDWGNVIGDDTLVFWQGLRDAGLLGDVIQEFHRELLETMKGLRERLQTPPIQLQAGILFYFSDAVLLNNIVQNFGLLDLIKKVLASNKSQMDRSREQYTRDLAALEQQCDEHRRRAKELKHKSQHLNNVLMTLTPVSMPPPAKRPRLTRATSGPAAISSQVSSQPTQITLPQGMSLSQLTGIPFGKVLSASSINKNSTCQGSSPSSPVLGGYTILAPSGSTFPSTLEIHPDSSNLTVLSTAAMQDSNTVLKMMSPIQLLTLPGLGTIQNFAQLASAGGTLVAMPCDSADGEDEHTTIEVTSLTEDDMQN